jgi:hypothetical protein
MTREAGPPVEHFAISAHYRASSEASTAVAHELLEVRATLLEAIAAMDRAARSTHPRAELHLFRFTAPAGSSSAATRVVATALLERGMIVPINSRHARMSVFQQDARPGSIHTPFNPANPLPWFHDGTGNILTEDEDLSLVACTTPLTAQPTPDEIRNAEFIVHATSMHEPLVTALRDLVTVCAAFEAAVSGLDQLELQHALHRANTLLRQTTRPD